MDRSEPLWTVADAAAFYTVSEATVRRWARQGLIPAHRVGGTARGQLRFVPSELHARLLRRGSGAVG